MIWVRSLLALTVSVVIRPPGSTIRRTKFEALYTNDVRRPRGSWIACTKLEPPSQVSVHRTPARLRMVRRTPVAS